MCDASDNANFFVNYEDYRTGLALDPKMVQKNAEMGVYEHVPEQEFQTDPHAKLIGTGCEENRSRLCAQEFAKGEQRDDLFAGTPPLPATKLLASLCASTGSSTGRG